MNTVQMKQQVRDFWDGLNRCDLDAQMGLVSDDVVFTVTGTTPVSGGNEGKDAVRAHFEHFGSLVEANPIMNVRELIAEGDTVVCLSEGVMKARTGRGYNNRYAFVFRFRGDKIVSVTEFLDTVLVETALFGKSVG